MSDKRNKRTAEESALDDLIADKSNDVCAADWEVFAV